MLLLRNLQQCARLTTKNFTNIKQLGYVQKPIQVKFLSSSTIAMNKKPENERIYYGTLTPQIKAVKVFSIVTSLGGLAAQPILIEQGSKMGGMPMVVFLCGFVGFFTFVTPFLLHFISKKYVTEMFYNSEKNEYTANTITLFLTKKELKFKLEDVVVPDVPGMFASFVIKGNGLFVDPTLFPDPNHYIKMMGYDKPIDFKLDLTENKNNDVKKEK